MTIPLEVYRELRVVPVRFAPRLPTGTPDVTRPDLDLRGFAEDPHGAVVGMMAYGTCSVTLQRRSITAEPRLFLTSSDPGLVQIVEPAGGALPSQATMDITLRAGLGGNPNRARIDVHCGSAAGPVLSSLHVRIYQRLEVWLAPHIVLIGGPNRSQAPVPPGNLDVDAVMAGAGAIWAPCGIAFRVAPPDRFELRLSHPGVVMDEPGVGDIPQVLRSYWRRSCINIYFVHRIGTRRMLGYGFSRSSMRRYRLPNPGILLAETNTTHFERLPYDWSNDLAHEIGHFLGLWHPERREPPRTRQDLWSRRRLMHNNNPMNPMEAWRSEFGYGPDRRGTLITQKNLPQLRTDGECMTARATLLRPGEL